MAMSTAPPNPGFSPLIVRFYPSPAPRWFSPWRTFLTRTVLLEVPLTYTRPDGTICTIPAGFASDGPSFPVFLDWLLPSRFDAMESGIYHDYLCRVRNYALSWVDGEFREALHSQGISPTMASLCYLGLRFAAYFHLR